MPSNKKWNFDWSGRMEQLEERLAMSADSLGGLLGREIEQQAIVDDLPPMEQHVESTPDFWIDSSDQETLNDIGRQIDQALAEAHAQTGLLDVRANYGFTGIGQTVAVIDSGIAYDHSALGGGYGSNYRVVGGWDFTGENDADPYDDGPSGSHGTHVAGIVGGDSSTDSGVAPGVDLVALRVFDDAGAGYFSWVEDALNWIHDNKNSFENPITTVNLSLGVSSWNSETAPAWANLEDEFAHLEADGIFIAVSAGNSYSSFNTTGLSYPAASQYVIPVMSTDDTGLMSYFSQRSSRAIAAPGRWITSTVPDYAGNNNGIADDYATKSGTSMAAPYVAGASVIIREAMEFAGYTNITQDTIYDQMMATADSFFDPATNQSYSRLNVQAAVDALMPADDFGSDISSAFALGPLSNSLSVSGVIGTVDDVDFFSFTAGASGTVSMSVTNATHELLANYTVIGAVGTLSNNVLSFDVVDGQTYSVSVETVAGNGIGYYDVDLSLVAAQLPVSVVTVKTMTSSTGAVYSLDSENWLSIDGTRTWSDTRDFSISSDQSFFLLGTNGQLDRLSSLGVWTTLDINVTKFSVSNSGLTYSLDSSNVLSIDGVPIWSRTDDFQIASDQTIFWQSTNGGLYHRLSTGAWEIIDSDSTKFVVRENGTIYSLSTDGWLNINGTSVWKNTYDFSLNDDQALNWYSSSGRLYQLSSSNTWQLFGSNVEEVAVRHDGVTYSLTSAGEVSMDGVLTWSNVSGMYTDLEGYLVLGKANAADQREAGRFYLSGGQTIQNTGFVVQTNQQVAEEVSEDSLEGQMLFAGIQETANGGQVNRVSQTFQLNGIVTNNLDGRFHTTALQLSNSETQESSQNSLAAGDPFVAWDGTWFGRYAASKLDDEFAENEDDLESGLSETDAIDSWFERVGKS